MPSCASGCGVALAGTRTLAQVSWIPSRSRPRQWEAKSKERGFDPAKKKVEGRKRHLLVAKEGKETDWQRLMPPRGFRVLPRRWVVERTFAWISHNRRMAKDYERLCATGEAFVYVAMTRLMVRRLARV